MGIEGRKPSPLRIDKRSIYKIKLCHRTCVQLETLAALDCGLKAQIRSILARSLLEIVGVTLAALIQMT